MAKKNKYFDITSMNEAAKRIAQREMAQEDMPFAVEEQDDFAGMQEYDPESEAYVAPEATEEVLGFTAAEVANIEEQARAKGLRIENLKTLGAIIDSINEEVNGGWKSKKEALSEIEGYIAQLIEAQSEATPVMQTPTEETLVQTPDEAVDESTPLEIQEYEAKAESDNKGITPGEAEEDAKSIKLPETPEEMGEEDLESMPIAYEVGGKVFAKQNIFRVTPQAEKMLEAFGKENLVANRLFDRSAYWAAKAIRQQYYIEDADMSEIKAALYRNLLNALSVRQRYDPRSGQTKTETDYRLKFFADAPELVPAELQADWVRIEETFDAELRSRQEDQIAAGKQPQQRLYDVTKEAIVANSGISQGLILGLNRLINSGDERILDPVFKEATHLTIYEIGHRERGDKQMPTMVGEEGQEKDITELGLPSTSQKVTETGKVDFKTNQQTFGQSAKMMGDFSDDVWESLSASTSDPAEYARFDKIKLKMELVKQQSDALFGTDESKYDSTIAKVYNKDGTVIWDREPKVIKVTMPDGAPRAVNFNTQMKDIVSKETFYYNYINLLKMKQAIQAVVSQMSININNPQSVPAIQQRVSEIDPAFKTEAMQAFLNDPKFIKMTALQNPMDTKTEISKVAGNPKQARMIDDSFMIIWGVLAADSLIAVAKKTNKLQEELAGASDVERKKVIDDFVRARQNYISVIGVHSTLLDESGGKPKLGKNRKLKSLFGVSLTARDIMQMIAGYRPIPEEIMSKLSAHKYELASRVYNNMMMKVSSLTKMMTGITKIASNYSLSDIELLIDKIIAEDTNKIQEIMK